MSRISEVLERLAAVIEARKGGDPTASYTAGLLADPVRAAKKLGEEAVETVIAAIENERHHLIAEGADLMFHFLVLLKARGVTFEEIEAALAQRTTMSGLEEKAARNRE
jgi:phosphoribosyl-ATP pyrophosphohydrolase